MPAVFWNVGMQPANQPPIAVVAPAEQRAVIGVTVKVDGKSSYDPDGTPVSPVATDLTYTWSFVEVPISSNAIQEGFESLNAEGSVVGFSPDITGRYVVGLVVSDRQFSSPRAEAKKLMWEYYRDNKETLPKWIREYREEIISRIQDGSDAGDLFAEIIESVESDMDELRAA